MITRATPAMQLASKHRRHTSQHLIAMLMAGSALTLPGTALAQTVTWDGDTSSDFSTATNWDGNAVPTAGSTVSVDGAGGPNQPTVSNQQTVGQTFVTGGSLTVASTLTSPTTGVSASGNLVVRTIGTLVGNLDVSGSGTVSNAGAINGAVSHGGASFTNSGSISGLVETTAGTFNSTGAMNGGLDHFGGTATVAGTLNGPVNNESALIIGGNLVGNGSAVANQLTGTITVNSGASWTGVGTVTNSSTTADGILINGAMTLGPNAGFALNDGASVRVATGGTLSLDNPASGSGDFRIIMGSNAQFRNEGTVNAGLTARSGSSGAILINSGQWNGILNIGQNNSGTNNGVWNLPDLIGFADATIRGFFENNGTINDGQISVSTANGRLINSGTVNNPTAQFLSRASDGGFIENRTNWTGSLLARTNGSVLNSGTITGAFINEATGTLTSTGTITAGLDNSATATVHGTLGGPINNLAGTLTVDGSLSSNAALVNSGAGTITVDAGAVWSGLTSISNAGILNNIGTLIGTVTNDATATLVSTGTITGGLENRGTATLRGSVTGTVNHLAGLLTVDGALTAPEVRMPDFGSAVTSANPGNLVVTAGGSIIGTLRVSGFEFAGVARRIEGPITVAPNTGISVTAGGIAEFSSLTLGNGGVERSGFVSVSGAGSRLSADAFGVDGASHTILVSAGGRLSTDQAGLARGSATVTGAGSIWDIAATSNNNTNFGLFAPITLKVEDGGRINSLNPSSMQIGGGSDVRIAGAGSAIELASSISIGGTNGSGPAGSFVIEDGGSLIVHSPNGAGVGFSQRGEVTIRSGGSWILDGGPNAGVQFNAANLLIDGGTFSAGGIVSHSGTILNLRNANFTARELDASNLVQIGGGAADPAAPAGIFNVGTVLLRGNSQLVLNHTEQNYVINSSFQGLPTARISHIAGDTIFTGAFGGYGGEFNITGGSVRFNGAFGSNGARAIVDSVGELASVGGSGTFGGSLSVVSGILAPGNSPGVLNIGGDLLLGPNALLAFELGAPGGTPGVGSDLINVTGNLTLDGTLNVANAGGFGAGLYRLINYGGSLTDNGLELGSLPSGIVTTDLEIQTSVANQVNLLVASSAPTSFPFWDGSATSGDGTIAGGSGTWTATATNWTTAAATANGAYNPEDLLIFTSAREGETEGPGLAVGRLAPGIIAATPSASAGTVTVDASAGAITLENGMQFAVSGYTLTGDDIVLAATEPCGECTPFPGFTVVRVGDGTEASAGFVTTIESRLTGESGLRKTDRGTLILSGANSYSGGTEIAGGMLQGDAGSLQGDIAILTGGTLLFTQASDASYQDTLSGSGIFAKQGAGQLRLVGRSSRFDGITALTEGDLAIDGALGSALSTLEASGSATLSGAGRIGGSVVVEDATVSPGGTVIPRNETRVAFAAAAAASAGPVGLLTIDGDFSLTGASILAFQLGDPAGEAGIASDLINVGGNLTLDGTLDVTDAGGFGAGLYRLINYDGTLADNGLAVGATPEGFVAADLTVQTSVANQVNLLVGTPVTSFNFWDGGNTSGIGVVDGGTASWRADTANWTLADGSRNGAVDPAQLLVFAGTAGTVTVDTSGGPVRATAGLQFATGGYRIEGGAIALDGTTATMRVGDGTAAGAGTTATIASVLTGAAQLEKTDLGTLVLSGMNTYTGGTLVLGGTLQIADNAALGAAQGAVTLDGGTLRTTAALNSARSFAIGIGGGAFDSGANALTLSGSISGPGDLRLAGSGARTFSGNSSAYSGSATLAAGSLALSGSLGGRLIVATPATLAGTGRAGNLDLSGTLSPGAALGNTGTFNVTGDLIVRSGSTLQVDLAASGASDKVEVGGRALLEGGTVAITTLDPDLNYSNGTVYRIVNAAGGLSGTFSGLNETSAFLDFALGYDPTGAFLTTTVIRQFPDVAKTFNQVQAATALKDLERAAGGSGLATYNAILLLDAAPARAAFDASSGEIYPTLLASRQRAGLALAGRIAMRGRAGGTAGLALWGGVLGDRGSVDSDGNGARSTADSFGWESGFDYRGADNSWAVGFGGGWQEGDTTLPGRGSRAKTDAWHIGGYARYGSGGTGISMVASLAHANADASVTRQIGFGTISRTAVSKVDLRTTAASGELRFGWGSQALAVGPLVSIDHTSTRLGRIAETGAGALNLSGAGKREGWTRIGVGGFARYSLGSGFADVALRYVNRSRGVTQLDLAMEGSPTGYAVRAAAGSRGALRVDASSEFAIGNRWAISGNLGATHAHSEGQIDGSLRLSYRF